MVLLQQKLSCQIGVLNTFIYPRYKASHIARHSTSRRIPNFDLDLADIPNLDLYRESSSDPITDAALRKPYHNMGAGIFGLTVGRIARRESLPE